MSRKVLAREAQYEQSPREFGEEEAVDEEAPKRQEESLDRIQQTTASKAQASSVQQASLTTSDMSATLASSQPSPTFRVPQQAGRSSVYDRHQSYGTREADSAPEAAGMAYLPASSLSPSSSSSILTHPPHAEHGGQALPLVSGAGMPATPDLSRPASSSSSSASSTSYPSAPGRRLDTGGRSLMRPSYAENTYENRPSSASTSAPSPASALDSSLYTTSSFPASTSQQTRRASPSKSVLSATSSEQRHKPSIEGFSRTRNGWTYRLVVVQHPTRARMCGFGDKDRRPLSPTLIVKLVITDEKTGQAVSPWLVNTSLFFLASDLRHPDDLMLSPRNVLVHQHAASVPTAVLQQQQEQLHSYETTGLLAPSSQSQSSAGTGAPLKPRAIDAGARSSSYEDTYSMPSGQRGIVPPASLTTFTTEHYTRNLVGAAVTSANVLRDETDNYAIFFVLQDLSVRTEGVYRIRLIFTDLAQQDGKTNEGVSVALAEAYTEPFSVYSPRRFPGMLEPTELSKKLASQGIKIAVRSDKKKRRRDSTERNTNAGDDDDE